MSREDIDQSQIRFSNTTIDKLANADRRKSNVDQLRATTASCLTLPKKQTETPGEQMYAASAKAAKKYRKKTHDDRWEEI